MKELITRPQADALIWAVAAFGVIAGPIAGLIARKRGESAAKFGTLVGGPLILAAIMWRIYNAIEDRLGLDSVAALAINFVLFVAVGAACGLGWTLVFGRNQDKASPADTPTE